MKKLKFFLAFIGLCSASMAQTTLIQEDFEGATLAVSTYSTSGTNSWSLNSNLQVSGQKSDSSSVQLGDTIYLETQAFDASAVSFMTLEFEHICKIDFFDKAIVEVSIDNGSNWTQLTSSEYTGSAFFSSNSFSAVSYSNWNIAQPNAIPDNTWWVKETFNLGSFVGNMQTKVRFVLIDADNNGAVNNYGWLIDDLKITGAPCELIPPSISLSGVTYQGQVYTTGPYNIQADITDASGVDSVSLSYSVNSGATTSQLMVLQSGNTYQATIPSVNVGDTVCYSIFANDNTTCSNASVFPSTTSCMQFIVGNNPPPNCVGTPVFSYPYLETFASFTSGNGTNVGTLRNNWENSNADTHDWYVLNMSTTSTGTGPSSGHTSTDPNYIYVEASNQFNRTAILNTPCYDMSTLNAPKFSFWYHMEGANMGELHLDIYFGGNWVLDIMPPLIGAQGSNWNFKEIDLTSYAGNIVQLRFRGITGGGYQSDIAIDDIAIIEPLSNDLVLDDVITPNVSGCNGSANDFVTLKVKNAGSAIQDTIPLAYRLNGAAIVRDTAFVALNPGDSINHTFQQTVNLAALGNYSFDFWVELAGEQNVIDDSIFNYTVSSSSVVSSFPDTMDFDNFTVGIPGTLNNGWVNSIYDSHDWYVHSGATTSGGTGPSGDNTSGTGNYMYVEASNLFNLEAILMSQCYDIRNLNQPNLNFYYHMLGAQLGELHVDIQVNGIEIKDIITPIVGNQGSSWLMGNIDLTPYKGVVKLIFRGITGPGYQSDIAIDDIEVFDANPVGIAETETKTVWTFYPNPSHDFIYINIGNSNSAAELNVRNSIGQIVLNSSLRASNSKIDVSHLEGGVYFLEVVTETQRSLKKLIIK